MKKVVVIGGGLGGLSCAIRLAAAGLQVTVIERQSAVGGMLQRVSSQGYTFDRGPNMIVMPHLFEHVFLGAGRRMEDYLQFYPISPYVRNIFHDGMQVDVTGRMHEVAEQIALYSPEDAARYIPFMEEAGRLYWIFRRRLQNQLFLNRRELLHPRMLLEFLKIRPFTSFHALLKRYFRHPHTLTMLGRHFVSWRFSVTGSVNVGDDRPCGIPHRCRWRQRRRLPDRQSV